jgi:hypothetical protein
MVLAYWLIGRESGEGEQEGAKRTGGDELIERLWVRLTERLVAGFGARTLLCPFCRTYPAGPVLPSELGGPENWTQTLSKFKDRRARDFRRARGC